MDILLYVNFIPKTAIDDLYVKVFRNIRTTVILKCIFKDNQWLYEEMPRWVCVKARYSNYGRI